jgi:hypothetical protein
MGCDGNAIRGNDSPLVGPNDAPGIELPRSNRVCGTKRFHDCAESHQREAWENQNRKPLRSQSVIFGITIGSSITFARICPATKVASSFGHSGHLHRPLKCVPRHLIGAVGASLVCARADWLNRAVRLSSPSTRTFRMPTIWSLSGAAAGRRHRSLDRLVCRFEAEKARSSTRANISRPGVGFQRS